MNKYETAYSASLEQIENLLTKKYQPSEVDLSVRINLVNEMPSELDALDYLGSIMFGLAGLFLVSKKEFSTYLEDIHHAASGSSGQYDKLQTILGKLLYHRGDAIDQIDGSFVNRSGKNAQGIFHRLFWGHDILSIEKDNPFYLMIQKNGILKGILQVVRHLIADTMSRQGLPIPGSSFLDYIKSDSKRSNYLIDIAKSLANDANIKIQAEKIYANIFTIRAQDVASGTVVSLLSNAYFSAREIDDKIRKTQFLLISYSINFFGEAIIGARKQGGVPYINIPLASLIISSLIKLYKQNWKEICQLQEDTNKLAKRNDELSKAVQLVSGELQAYNKSQNYMRDLINAENNVKQLMNFLGEDCEN
ncbi:MAG: hypothetical protein QM308_01370 [Bacillota bacterium]|nr:hypothetical protein [Bacillota bacterium]